MVRLSEENKHSKKILTSEKNNSFKDIFQSPVFLLTIIGVITLVIRVYYFPYEIPITLDGSNYFWYTVDMSLLDEFPPGYTFPNNGWPSFLYIFFSLFNSDDFLDYMNLQRSLSIIISVSTIIPVYLLCTRFFKKQYAILGSILFAFEPRLILNSTLGISEPLFIMLGTISLYFFLSKKWMYIYLSFVIAALYTLVRYEGLLLIVPLSIIFLIRFRKDKKVVLKYLVVISLFVLILLPMMYIRSETTGQDGVISHVSGATKSAIALDGQEQSQIFEIIGYTFGNFSKYFIWILIPSLLFFVPYGLIMLFKNRDLNKITLILVGVALLIPALYAYFRNISDTRYLLSIIPILCVISVYTFEKIDQRFKKPGFLITVFIICLFVTSIVFLEYNKVDYGHEIEAFEIAKEVTKRTSVINHSYHIDFDVPESKYYRAANLLNLQTFPILRAEIPDRIEFVELVGHDSLESYIEFGKKMGLTYLVIDDSSLQPAFLQDVFVHEEKYPYLLKEFDSRNSGYQYHVKIFRIDYEVLK